MFIVCHVHFCYAKNCFSYLAGTGGPGTPGSTGQPSAGEGGSNTVRKRQKTSSDPESDASESEFLNNINQKVIDSTPFGSTVEALLANTLKREFNRIIQNSHPAIVVEFEECWYTEHKLSRVNFQIAKVKIILAIWYGNKNIQSIELWTILKVSFHCCSKNMQF